jgi:hypothetical protein
VSDGSSILRAHTLAANARVPLAANYRRLLGDRHWPMDTPFPSAVSYFPAPLVTLRTLKAGLAVGISPELQRKSELTHPTGSWLTSGAFGTIQFAGVSGAKT